jgi:hypothetical protein
VAAAALTGPRLVAGGDLKKVIPQVGIKPDPQPHNPAVVARVKPTLAMNTRLRCNRGEVARLFEQPLLGWGKWRILRG